MDVAALASLLSRLMPALLGADQPAVDSLAEAAGASVAVDARRIWECLGPRVAQCPAAEEATRKVAQVPSDARWRTALELQLEELFAREPQLAGEIGDLVIPRDGPSGDEDATDAGPVLAGDATVATAVRDAPAARAINQILHDVMARFCADGQPGDDPPGAMLFDRVDGRVCQLAREHSRAGRRRVVAVAAAPTVLESAAAWKLLDAGVADVVAWDGDDAAVAARIEHWRAVDELVASPVIAEHLVGTSPAWRAVLREVVEIARFSDVDVLITGESGTGKELIAQLIHTLDPRADKGDLIVVDCTTIVPSLSGSELFGHLRTRRARPRPDRGPRRRGRRALRVPRDQGPPPRQPHHGRGLYRRAALPAARPLRRHGRDVDGRAAGHRVRRRRLRHSASGVVHGRLARAGRVPGSAQPAPQHPH